MNTRKKFKKQKQESKKKYKILYTILKTKQKRETLINGVKMLINKIK